MSISKSYGPFELHERISVGGMAEVFRAVETQSGRTVALKRILPNVAEDDEFIALFSDETKIASALQHPNIAGIVSAGEFAGAHYIAMEFVNGRPLRTLVDRTAARGGRIPVAVSVLIAQAVARALAYAHDRTDPSGRPLGIVHRDVSPQNVLISYAGEVKLIDFGIAKAAGKITRTQAGNIKGKVGYMSPEQVLGATVDRRADVFALGICLWESLTGQRLFDGRNELAIMELIRECRVPAPSQFVEGIPPELDRAVLKALAKDQKQRYATARDFEVDLESVLRHMPGGADARRITSFMRELFPEETARFGSAGQESSWMSKDGGGSDLDVFDGLAKKSSKVPAPPSGRSAPPVVKKTLLGLAAPVAPPPSRSSGRPIPPPSRPSLPAASGPPSLPRASGPPGRPSSPGVSRPPLPPAAPPPWAGGPRSPSRPPMPGSLPPKPPPAAAAPVDMDWDDEDEKTAVFDKADDNAGELLRAGPSMPTPPPSSKIGAGAAALLGKSSGAPPPSMPMPPVSGGPPMPPPVSMPPVVSAPPPQMPAPAYQQAQPASGGGAGKTALIALAALMAVGLIATLIVLMLPKSGTLVVTVAGPGNKAVDAVQVYVDGSQRCDSSPCRVADIPGGTHMVKVTAAGYQATADQAVKIASGEDAVLNVTLARASEGTGIRVSAETAGAVKLFVDGKEIGPLPQELKDMTPGEHVIKIVGDRYEAWEKRITVEDGKLEPLDPKLKVVKGLAIIKAGNGAQGARVLLVSGSERRPIPSLPIRIDITTDKPWSVIATRAGYDDFKKDIVFEDGKAEETFTVDMFEKGKSPTDPPSAAGGPVPGPLPGPKPGPGPVVAPGPKPGPGPAPAAAGDGTLNINSIPVSNVILDGRPLGTTPKVGLKVSAGNHTVVFVHAEHGRKVRSVKVPAGGSATAAVRFP